MTLARLTKRTVDNTLPDPDRDVWVWDAELKGFGMRVRPSGHRVYVIEYRPGAGGRSAPKRRLTIGRHGSPWTPETARREAERILGLVASGTDPASNKAALRGSPTVAEFCERWLVEHVERKRKESTAKLYHSMAERFIKPAIGRRKVSEVTRQDVARLHASLRATPYQANRCLAVVSALFNYAELMGERPAASNPARGVERFGEQSRERLLSAFELGSIGEALRQAERDGTTPLQAVAFFRLLMFTGARSSEILTLQWAWVDMARGEARLPDSKTGRKTIHLPPPAIEVLASLPRLNSNPFVIFAAKGAGGHLVGIHKPWRRVLDAAAVIAWSTGGGALAALVASTGAELGRAPTAAECRGAAAAGGVDLPEHFAGLRLHDLRHAFASVAAGSGLGLPIIGKLLGHTQPITTARYAHLAADPLKAAAAAVAGSIDDALRARTSSESEA